MTTTFVNSTASASVHYACGHTDSLPQGDSSVQAPQICRCCNSEDLSNPYAGTYGFHVQIVTRDGSYAGPLEHQPRHDTGPAWFEDRGSAVTVAANLRTGHHAAAAHPCPGPGACSVGDHGDGWVKLIARMAADHEIHGRGNVRIDEYDAACRHQRAALGKP